MTSGSRFSLRGWLCDFEQVCSTPILLFSVVQMKLVWCCAAPQKGIGILSLQPEPCSTMNFTFIVTFWRYYVVMTHCSSNFCTVSLWALPICHDSISLGISDERIEIKRENKKSISNGFQIPISYKRELNIALILQPSSHITWIKTSKLFKIKNPVKSWNIYKVI